MGYFSIENIDNPCLLTIACNPKEYYELFENSEINKEHKETKKGSSAMNFENYAERIVSLTNFDYFKKKTAEYKEVFRLPVDHGQMQKKTSLKTRLSQFNDKRFYFSNGVTLPLHHPLLKD